LRPIIDPAENQIKRSQWKTDEESKFKLHCGHCREKSKTICQTRHQQNLPAAQVAPVVFAKRRIETIAAIRGMK
jgi:hypothetical protein